MKAYKIFRKVLAASAITSAMFVMQACYGTPVQQGELYDDDTMAVSDLDEAVADETTLADGTDATETSPQPEPADQAH